MQWSCLKPNVIFWSEYYQCKSIYTLIFILHRWKQNQITICTLLTHIAKAAPVQCRRLKNLFSRFGFSFFSFSYISRGKYLDVKCFLIALALYQNRFDFRNISIPCVRSSVYRYIALLRCTIKRIDSYRWKYENCVVVSWKSRR